MDFKENTVAIIIAAGEATRWGNHLGVAKHFVPIDGTPILERTVSQLNRHDIKPYIVANTDEYDLPGARLYKPTHQPLNHDADKFLNSEDLWNTFGRTIVLYGDVFFTDEAMSTIVEHKGEDWVLFGRRGPNRFTGTEAGECFAQSFYPKDLGDHRTALKYIAMLKRNNKIIRCGGWEHYRAMEGLPIDPLKGNPKGERFIKIDDWTNDFDFPADYEAFVNAWEKK